MASHTSFQFRLFRLFTTLTAAIAVIFTVLYSVAEFHKSRAFVEKVLLLQARNLAETIRLPLYAENRTRLTQLAGEMLLLPEIRKVEIAAADGRVLVRVSAHLPAEGERLITRKEEVRINASLSTATSVLETPTANKTIVGFVTLYRSTDDLTNACRRLLTTTIALALLFWLLVSLSSYLLLKRVTRSFQGLMTGLNHVHAGNYSARIPILSDDEPGRASMAINELACSLERRDLENSRLNAELRTAMEVETATKEQLARLNGELEQEIALSSGARNELKQLVEHLPVGIIWSDTTGGVEYLNSFITSRFGYAPESLRTMEEWFALALPDLTYRERIVEMRKEAIAARHNPPNETSFLAIRVTCKDGSVCEVNLSIQLSGSRIIDIMIDTTEREQLQLQIIRNQKLESLGVLAAGVAHNFNNALTGVLGFVSFAKRFVDETHRSFKPLCHAESASVRAADLAKQLMIFAKRSTPVKSVVSAKKLVKEALDLATSGSQIVSSIEFPPSLNPLYVDEGQISQVFSCICINAVQAMAEGGTLTVRARNVSTETEKLLVPESGDYLELSFQDQGGGIAELDQPHIFTPYFTTKAEVGHGLGLATVYSIITRHGGGISFHSTLGKGTTFVLYLPVAKNGEAELQPLEKAENYLAGQGRSILVMDDEEMIRSFVQTVLEEQGYRVVSCSSGDQALALYREAYPSDTPYMAAILDLTVPGGIGGKEVARRILELDPHARLIVSSGHYNDVVVKDFKNYGFCAAAVKPYHANELLDLLSKLPE